MTCVTYVFCVTYVSKFDVTYMYKKLTAGGNQLSYQLWKKLVAEL